MGIDYWTDERVERLKTLYASGDSASQIANELGSGVTRNGVIGKVHRLGLERRGRTAGTRRSAKVNTQRIRSNPMVDRWAPKRAPVPFTCKPAADVISRGLSIMDLMPDDCRFPYGDTPFLLFCGHPKISGSSYCPSHFALVRRDTKVRDGMPAKMPINLADGRHGRAVLA